MKALVLSGGSGTRLRPLTFTRSKQLLPVANRPLLHHVLDNIAATGIKDVVIVTGTNTVEIQNSVGDGSAWHLDLQFVTQSKPLGLAHAVLTAENVLGGEAFIMYLGDNILPGGITEYLRVFSEDSPDTLVLLHPVKNPQSFGIAVLEGNRVIRLVEKPIDPPSNLGLVGIYFFSPAIHQAIHRINPSSRGELEITDAIQYQLETGLRVEARLVDGVWHDAGKPEDLLEANRSFLQQVHPQIDPKTEIIESALIGPIDLEAGCLISRSRICGPVAIGKDCIIQNSSIGPFASIGDRSTVTSSCIENSILLPGCQVTDIPMLTGSILGEDCQLDRKKEIQGFHMIAGDQTSLSWPES